MSKKVGISLLLAFAILVSTFNVGIITTAYATAPCTTLAECRELQQETLDNIADILEEGEEVSEYILELQAEISDLRDEIADLEDRISDLESEIEDLANKLIRLADEIEKNIEIYEDTEDRIEFLIDEISIRMRITQRVNNTNTFFAILSESENIADFVRRARTFSRFAEEDAEYMDELVDLIEFQENLLHELEEQRDEFQEKTDLREALRDELEIEQENLEEEQIELIERETEMQDKLYELNLTLMEEEELLEAIEEAEEILSRVPPPNITLRDLPSLSRTPTERGLEHPMPGAIVTSEFGPRGGRHHSGIDLVVVGDASAPLLASAAGTVIINHWHNALGWYIVISHNINDQRVDTLYAHLGYQSEVEVGTIVSQGERVGTKGSTGHSTGPHLHFEVHPGGWAWGNSVNPRRWIDF